MALFAGLVSSAALAAAPVVDIHDNSGVTAVRAGATPYTTSPTATAPATPSRPDQLGDLFLQLQQLQHEVLELRGIIEQQNFDIQTLKQQVKDNYVDLDKRLAAQSAAPATGAGAQANGATPPAVSAAPATTVQSANPAVAPMASTSPAAAQPGNGAEKDSYDAAYKLLEQNRKDDAIAAFRKHLAAYPSGEYAGNANYWLGQLYLTQGQLPQAEEQFNALLKNFPDHRKAPDARFALGKLYFQQGKKAEAKKLIQDVAQGDSKTAALARAFLQDNF